LGKEWKKGRLQLSRNWDAQIYKIASQRVLCDGALSKSRFVDEDVANEIQLGEI
jgi:hypothetical protein